MRSLAFALALLFPVMLIGQTVSSANPATNVSGAGQQIATVEGLPSVNPPIVNTVLNTAVTAPGSATITPSNMNGIAPGIQLIVGSGVSQEVITVSSTVSSTPPPANTPARFEATFAKTHLATDVLVARPSGLTGIDSSGNLSFDAAEQLLDNTVCRAPLSPGSPDCNLDATDTYAIIHVLAWGPPAKDSSNDVKSIKSTNWYVYRKHGNAWIGHWGQADFSGNNRLYGAGTIVFLYVELNASVDTCDPYHVRYQLTISKRVPTNIQAVQQLAQIIIPSDAAAKKPTIAAPCPAYVLTNVWGGRVIKVGYKTSDIKIDSYQVTQTAGPPPTSVSTPLSASVSLINEKKQWWDVSVAVPVKSVSDLQYTSSNDTVVPTKITKQNVFAVADLYLPPIDLAGTTYSMIPHPIIGVSMASQPLHSILVGGAVGLHFAEIYVGSDFVKQQTLSGLSSGSAATPQQLSSATSNKFKAQFVVGINLPVKAAYSALTKTKQ